MKQVPFEQAFARLEEILRQMNSGQVNLDDSLKLFEEASKLIKQCNTRLTEAEGKIELLIKKRDGDLEVDADGQPRTEEFDH